MMMMMMMMIIIIIIIIIIIGAAGTISKSSRKYPRKENTKSRNYRRQPYWALHTYRAKY